MTTEDVGLNFWLTQWNWQPSIIIGTIAIIGAYLYAIGPFREKYHPGAPVTMGQVIAFLLGVNCIFLVLFSPLDKLGDDYLFSAHMVQHLFLTIVGPPLMILGTPAWLAQALLSQRFVLAIGKFVTRPAIAFVLYNVNFWLWHLPVLYDVTLYNPTLHILEHLTFIVTGVIYWWPVFSPLKEGLPRLSPAGQILYIFLGSMPTVALGAGLTFLPPLYTPYINAPRVWELTPAVDQQLGGLIMWVPANLAYIAIASIFFIDWLQTQEIRQRQAEAKMDEEQHIEAAEQAS